MSMPNRNNGSGDLPSSGAVLSWKPGRGGEAKELITVEKDRELNYEIPEVAQKTVLENNDEAIDFAQAIHHCIGFHMDNMLKEIYTMLALKPSVKGLSRQQFLSGITGVIWDYKTNTPLWNKNKDRDQRNYDKSRSD